MKTNSQGGVKTMKKTLAVLTVVAVLALGTVAFGHGWGYGGHMAGYGYGPMMGWGYGGYEGNTDESTEFLSKTADLRRELNAKMFDYKEARRAGDVKKAEELAGDIAKLREKIYENAPEGKYFTRGGYGPGGCWQ